MLTFITKTFAELTNTELYTLLQLRANVFIVEQNAPYLDLDDKDQIAMHFLGYDEGRLIAYGRVLPLNDSCSFGRIVVDKNYRGQNLGKRLVASILKYINHNMSHLPIEISAQCYLISFYTRFGFQSIGEQYLEDGLPHIKMIRQANYEQQ